MNSAFQLSLGKVRHLYHDEMLDYFHHVHGGVAESSELDTRIGCSQF